MLITSTINEEKIYKKKNRKKRLLLGLLLMVAGGICFFKTDTAYADVMTFVQLQEKFPDGK